MVEGGVGDLEEIGEFGLGKALKDSKPVTKIEISKEKEAEIATMQQFTDYQETDDDAILMQEEAMILAKMRKNKNKTSERRQPIGKNQAFGEFKETDEAKEIEAQIIEARGALKLKRIDLKEQTESLNAIKHDIDQVKSLLDQKTEQKNQHEITKSMAPGFTSVDDGLDASPNDINEVIDEEEL